MTNVSRRWLVRAGTLAAGVLLIAALLVIVNYFGWKYHKRLDWTSSHLYTLSERSENVIRDLKRDVDFIVLLPPNHQLYEPVKGLLSQYEAASARIRVRYIDPQKNRDTAQQIVSQFQLSGLDIVVLSGKDKRVIANTDLAELDLSGMQLDQEPTLSGFKGEQLFTGAILQLSEGRKRKVLFTTGHGERSLDDQGREGLSGIQAILGTDNFDVEEWSALGKSVVPAGADLVVVAGPKSPFLQPELDALAAYLGSGGRLLAMIDPNLGQAGSSGPSLTGFEGWLPRFGVRLDNNVVLDPPNTVSAGFTASTFYANDYGDHPVTKALLQSRLAVLLSVVRSVKGEERKGFTSTELLRTSNASWGETNLATNEEVVRGSDDLSGPLSLGVAVEGDKNSDGRFMRLVVFGDSDFATNEFILANVERGALPNGILLANALNWLVEREALLGIPPRKTEQVRLNLTQEQGYKVYAIALLLLPVLAATAGIAVWSRRRR